MAKTKLNYMEHNSCISEDAHVLDVCQRDDGKHVLCLDQTIFYPQGGGQPHDTGKIHCDQGEFDVEQVRYADGKVYHIGTFSKGSLAAGDQVRLEVNQSRRQLHNRLHTAGHLVDIAMWRLNVNLKPSKGYHFPDFPYIEYEGELDAQRRNEMAKLIEIEVERLINQDLPVEIKHIEWQELQQLSKHVPINVPQDKPIRIMRVKGHDAIPCGGTHVTNLKEIGTVKIQKIKVKKGKTRISYKKLQVG